MPLSLAHRISERVPNLMVNNLKGTYAPLNYTRRVSIFIKEVNAALIRWGKEGCMGVVASLVLSPYTRTHSTPAYLSSKKCQDRVKGKLAVLWVGQPPMLFDSFASMKSFFIGSFAPPLYSLTQRLFLVCGRGKNCLAMQLDQLIK